jgi:hypothetical protein
MIETIYTVKDHQPRQFQSMIPKGGNRFSKKIMLKQTARDAKCRASEDQNDDTSTQIESVIETTRSIATVWRREPTS